MGLPPDSLAGSGCDLVLEPPCVYLLHFLDDDVLIPGASFGLLAELLEPCRVVLLGYDEEAYSCNSLAGVVDLYVGRLLDDVKKSPAAQSCENALPRIVLAGYAFGAVIAHQVACLLEERGANVAVIYLDSEVSWPPSFSLDRMGGYQWQGGVVEAALLICRALGALDFARAIVAARLAHCDEEQNVEDLHMRIFWELAPKGLTMPHFQERVLKYAPLLERMHAICLAADGPCKVFGGDALHIQSSSREFRQARDVNENVCRRGLHTATCRGTHYTLVQDGHVHSVIKSIADFLVSQGFFGQNVQSAALGHRPWLSQPLSVPGLEVASDEGDPHAGTIYIVHDARPCIADKWKNRVSELLSPCRVVFVTFDSEASNCTSMEELGELYHGRIVADVSARSGFFVTSADDQPVITA